MNSKPVIANVIARRDDEARLTGLAGNLLKKTLIIY
jgi:hypothetical protein